MTSWSDPQTLLTGVIAFATIVYVICTILLWRSTRAAREQPLRSTSKDNQRLDRSRNG